jgi:serine/threonine-protein kinase ATR
MLQLASSTSANRCVTGDTADLTTKNAVLGKQLISKHLIRAYKSALNNMGQDRAALAIQDCLAAYGCAKTFPIDGEFVLHKREEKSTGQELWSSLTQQDRDIIHPFLASNYRNPGKTPKSVVQPIYSNLKLSKFKGDRLMAFKQWMSTWMAMQVEHLKAAGDGPVAIFDACLVVAKDSLETTLFIMPHVVLHVILLRNEAINASVQSEMLAVLSDETPAEGLDPASPRLSATQAVFAVIDHMTHWLRRAERDKPELQTKPTKGSSKRRADPEMSAKLKEVEKFLHSLPHNVIALAAFRCQDYARALLHLELCPRPDKRTDDAELAGALSTDKLDSILQKTYYSLEDIDGVAGIAAIRSTKTLEDEILDHRAAGRWTHALSCFERVVQSGSADVAIAHHLGLLECQMMLGHLKTAVTHATGTIADHPDWAADLYGAVLGDINLC